MEQETPQYPQISQDEIDIWLTSRVTQTYMQCLEWFHKDTEDAARGDTLVDSSSADLTHALKHLNLGQQQGLQSALDHAKLFTRFGMVIPVEPEKEEEDDAED